MPMRDPRVAEAIQRELLVRDQRYALEAYEFVLDAWQHSQRLLGRATPRGKIEEAPDQHLSGRQLLEGIRDLALREFGLMARTVLGRWGVHRTDDFGEIVYNLIAIKLMSKTEEDTRADFHDVYDLDEALTRQYQIKLEDLD
jgi:uncharacterized repeat protein (TIGR04138 family)